MKSIRLWAILILALAARAALYSAAIQDCERAFTADSQEYWDLADTMAHTGLFESMTWPGGSVSPEPEIFRSPGYPTLLGCVLRLHWQLSPEASKLSPWLLPMGPGTWRAVLAMQVLIDLHLVLLTYWLGRELVGHGVGLLAALLQAVSPLAVAASCRILSDSLFAFMLTAALLLIVRHFRTGSWRALLPAAVLMGAACYVRPVGLVMSGLFVLVLLFRPKRIRRAGAFAGVIAACVAPWVVRNAVVADYVGFSSFATDSMYWYSAAEVLARKEGVSAAKVREGFFREEGWYSFDPDLVGQPGLSNAPCYRTPGGLARYRRDRAKKIVLAHPRLFLDIHLKGCLAFWLPAATDVLEVAGYTTGGKGTLAVLHEKGLLAAARHYFGGNTTAMWLAGAMALVLLARYAGIVLCGLWKLRLRMPAAAWLMILLVAASFLLPGPATHPRFRVPVAPILSVAAAVGWLGLIERLRRRKAPRHADCAHGTTARRTSDCSMLCSQGRGPFS